MVMTRVIFIALFLWVGLWGINPVAGLTILKYLVLFSTFVIPAWGLIWACLEILPKKYRDVGIFFVCLGPAVIPGIKLVGIIEPWFDELIKSAAR